MTIKLAILVLGGAIILSGCTTSASVPLETRPGWLEKTAALQQADHMRANNMLPVSIQCRIDGGSRANPVYSIKVKWQKTNLAKRWTWRVGNDQDIAIQDAEAKRDGMHQVSKSTTVDKRTGLPVVCVVWQT